MAGVADAFHFLLFKNHYSVIVRDYRDDSGAEKLLFFIINGNNAECRQCGKIAIEISRLDVCFNFLCPDFCDSDEDSDEDERDTNHKDGPDSSKISTTTTEDVKEREGAVNKLNSFGESDSRLRESRTEKSCADSRQSPVTHISSTTRSGEELKSPAGEQPKVDECRISKESYTTPLTVQTDAGAHLNQSHLHNFGFPAGLAGHQFFNHLGSAHPFLLHPGQFNMGGAFSNMAAGMGPLLAAVSSGGVTSMDTASMASPTQSLTGAPGVPFHLQQHVLASQVNSL